MREILLRIEKQSSSFGVERAEDCSLSALRYEVERKDEEV